jgi:outer membrane protein insertion porin family
MGINSTSLKPRHLCRACVEINGNIADSGQGPASRSVRAEGDASNSFQVKRSQDRINSPGYFQDKMEIK